MLSLQVWEHGILGVCFGTTTIQSLWKYHITIDFIAGTASFPVKIGNSFPLFPSWPEYPLMQHL